LDAVARTVDARREEAAPGRTTEAVAAALMVKTVADMILTVGVCLVSLLLTRVRGG